VKGREPDWQQAAAMFVQNREGVFDLNELSGLSHTTLRLRMDRG